MDLAKSSDFSARVEELLEQHHVPALSLAILHKDEVFSLGFGYSVIETETKCTPDTLFDIASSSKAFTAAAVGMLVDDDEKYPEVRYDALMSELLPGDFIMSGEGYTEGVTVDDVLGHTTGMGCHDNSYMGIHAEHPDSARSVTRNLRNLAVAVPLRSRYLYNNMMYTVATYLVEAKSKQTFPNFLEEHIFKPLHMDSTSLQPQAARDKGLGDRIATGYMWESKAKGYFGFQAPDTPEAQGAGSIITSVNDLIKWVKALLDHEPGSPINGKIYHGLTRMRSFANPGSRRLKPFTSPVFYTAGLEIYYYRGYTVIGHNGGIPGFGSRFVLVPEANFGAAILGNAEGTGPVSNILIQELLDEVIGVPLEERRGQKGRNKKSEADGRLKKQKKEKKKAKSKEARSTELEKENPQAPTAAGIPMRSAESRPSRQSNNSVLQVESPPTSKGDGDDPDEPQREHVHPGDDRQANDVQVQPAVDDVRQPQDQANTSKGQTKVGKIPKLVAKPQQPAKFKSQQPPQEMALEAYTGRFWHAGYHALTVQIKSERLFVDATDRSMGFTLTFEHVGDQKRYIAHLSDAWEGGDIPLDAVFELEEGVAVRMGIMFEDNIDDFIWFERAEDGKGSR